MQKELTEEEIHNMSQESFVMTEEIWNNISDNSKKALLTYMVESKPENNNTITFNDYREGHRIELGQTEENMPKVIIVSAIPKAAIAAVHETIKACWCAQMPAKKLIDLVKDEINVTILLK